MVAFLDYVVIFAWVLLQGFGDSVDRVSASLLSLQWFILSDGEIVLDIFGEDSSTVVGV